MIWFMDLHNCKWRFVNFKSAWHRKCSIECTCHPIYIALWLSHNIKCCNHVTSAQIGRREELPDSLNILEVVDTIKIWIELSWPSEHDHMSELWPYEVLVTKWRQDMHLTLETLAFVCDLCVLFLVYNSVYHRLEAASYAVIIWLWF